MVPPVSEGNAFTFDEDEDMDMLMEAAANAGSAAIDELDRELGIASAAPAQPEPTRQEPVTVTQPLGTPEPIQEDDFDLDSILAEAHAISEEEQANDLLAEMEAMRAQSDEIFAEATNASNVAQAPAPTVTQPAAASPVPEPATAPVREIVTEASAVTAPPVAKASPETPAPNRITVVPQTAEEKIKYARAIVGAVDEYRKLGAQAKNVAAQLISQEKELSEDEVVIAIRAYEADDLTFQTMAALKEAKALEPVDRAFFILGLSLPVRENLGMLAAAFSGKEISETDTLKFAKALVTAVDVLSADEIGYVTATEAVLRAAKS